MKIFTTLAILATIAAPSAVALTATQPRGVSSDVTPQVVDRVEPRKPADNPIKAVTDRNNFIQAAPKKKPSPVNKSIKKTKPANKTQNEHNHRCMYPMRPLVDGQCYNSDPCDPTTIKDPELHGDCAN